VALFPTMSPSNQQVVGELRFISDPSLKRAFRTPDLAPSGHRWPDHRHYCRPGKYQFPTRRVDIPADVGVIYGGSQPEPAARTGRDDPPPPGPTLSISESARGLPHSPSLAPEGLSLFAFGLSPPCGRKR